MRKGMKSRMSGVRKTSALVLPALLAVFIASACPLPAQFMSKQVNLVYLARRADVIVQGKVTEVVKEGLPEYPNIRTLKVTLSVEKMIRGPQVHNYTFREIILGDRAFKGKVGYAVGQRLLLFMPSPSQYGLSSPIGIEQGRFHIISDASGVLMAVNEYNNAGLFSNIAQDAGRAGQALNAGQLAITSSKPGPIPLDRLLTLVKSLTLLPRIQ